MREPAGGRAPTGEPVDPALAVVVMGVSASGKSTLGAALAAALGRPFVDGDDLHPAENVAKMAAGIPLTDADRAPWLDRLGTALADGAAAGGIVVACSALRRVHRDRLRTAAPRTAFIHLDVPERMLAARSTARAGHFMPATLLASQLATLEPLEADERGLVLDATAPVPELVAAAIRGLRGPAR